MTQSVHAAVTRALTASVEAKIGRWPEGDPARDPDFGLPLYEYADHKVSVILFEDGFQIGLIGAPVRAAYTTVKEVRPLPLGELVRHSRNPDATVHVGVVTQDGLTNLPMPLKVYSSLCPLLARLTGRVA